MSNNVTREVWSGEMLAKSMGRAVIVTRVYEKTSVTGGRIRYALLSEVTRPEIVTVVTANMLAPVEIEGDPVKPKPKPKHKPKVEAREET